MKKPTWDDYYEQGLAIYESQFDPENDDRDGYDICIEQQEFAEDYADDCFDEDEDDYDNEDDYDDGNEPGPGGQGLAWQTNEEWFDTLGEFHS